MIKPLLLVLAFTVAAATPAWPCSMIKDPVPTPADLVSQADVIARVRALPGDDPGARNAWILVKFSVLSVLKGTLADKEIGFSGYFEDRDDFNTGSAPYTFVRRGGTHGDCYARNYRENREYLLFMRKSPSGGALTPYWAALKPANEQIQGENDLWVTWVRGQLAK